MGKTVLTVDDSTSVRKLLQFTLESRGLNVKSAADGLEAWEVISHHPIDVIILDINMPKMNGLELLQKIKSDSVYATIPVIMLTTEGQEEEKEKAAALGASEYMVKPFKPSQLLALLDDILPGT